MIDTLSIIGVGLIGGSIAKGARLRGLCRKVIGFDRNADNLRQAISEGVVDEAADSLASVAVGADLVIVAVPVGVFSGVLRELSGVWNPAAVYTDVGSTKLSVIDALRDRFASVPENFVPGHPIAGAERSGVGAAVADLFEGRKVILTPLPETVPTALDLVRAFWSGLGAQVRELDPGFHDRVLAATSHLPHVIAFTLTYLVGQRDEQEAIFQYAAGGFRDFSRIAGSDPTMWRDICLANRAEIVPLIEHLRDELTRVANLIELRRESELLDFYCAAQAARQRFLDSYQQ